MPIETACRKCGQLAVVRPVSIPPTGPNAVGETLAPSEWAQIIDSPQRGTWKQIPKSR